MRRQGKSVRVYYGIDDDGAIFVGQSRSKSFANVAGFFDADSLCSHGFGNLGEIRILELHAEGDEACILLLDVDEVERAVVKDDLNYGTLSFYLRQQISEAEHEIGRASCRERV